MLTHFALMSWASAYDDIRHNYFLIRRRSDMKFMMLAWDADNLFVNNPTRDVLYGSYNDPDDADDYSRLKQIFFYAYNDEYLARIEWLTNTLITETYLDDLAEYVADDLWQYSEQEQALTPYDPSNDMETCYEESQPFISKRETYMQSLQSSFNPKTYQVNMCLDSPIVQPVFSAYKSSPGRLSPPTVVKDPDNNDYIITWYPANPNGNPVVLYELYVSTDTNPLAPPTLVYNGTGTNATWPRPQIQYPTTFSFTVKSSNSAGPAAISAPSDIQYFTDQSLSSFAADSIPVWYYISGVAAFLIIVVIIVVVVVAVTNKSKSKTEVYSKFTDTPSLAEPTL